jgi:hypothetical protein
VSVWDSSACNNPLHIIVNNADTLKINFNKPIPYLEILFTIEADLLSSKPIQCVKGMACRL